MNTIDFSELPHRGKYVDWKNVKSNTIILFWEEREKVLNFFKIMLTRL